MQSSTGGVLTSYLLLLVTLDESRKDDEEVMVDMVKVKRRMVTEGEGKNAKEIEAAMSILVSSMIHLVVSQFPGFSPRRRLCRSPCLGVVGRWTNDIRNKNENHVHAR